MPITSYATLQSAVADWLNRDDMTAVIPQFIANAEARFKRDLRVRKLQNAGTLVISADDQALASDLMAVEGWYLDGPTYFHRIQMVGAEALGELKTVWGSTGAPRYAALIAGSARFAPVPDASYETKLTYWRKIVSLSDQNVNNWLLEEHPDLYLYATLVEAAPYLQDDTRVATWQDQLDKRLAELDARTSAEQFPAQPQADDQRYTRTRP